MRGVTLESDSRPIEEAIDEGARKPEGKAGSLSAGLYALTNAELGAASRRASSSTAYAFPGFRPPQLPHVPVVELPATWRGKLRRFVFGTWRLPAPRFERGRDGELYYVEAKA